MANDIDDSFVKQFEDEVHLAYQRMGSKFLNTVRRKTNVVGSSTTFQKIGTVTAGTKSRNGQVPISNQDHDPIECTLTDYYSGQYIDKLDELKQQHDERSVTTTNQAAAMGRKSDAIIIAAMQAGVSANKSAATTGACNKSKFDEAYKYLGENDVYMEDGMLFAAVSPAGWLDLMDLESFASADYVGQDNQVFNGPVVAKNWMNFNIFQHSGLTNPSGTVRNCWAYHKSAVGHASGQEVNIDITWQGKEQAHLSVASISEGAVEIDNRGIFQIQFTE